MQSPEFVCYDFRLLWKSKRVWLLLGPKGAKFRFRLRSYFFCCRNMDIIDFLSVIWGVLLNSPTRLSSSGVYSVEDFSRWVKLDFQDRFEIDVFWHSLYQLSPPPQTLYKHVVAVKATIDKQSPHRKLLFKDRSLFMDVPSREILTPNHNIFRHHFQSVYGFWNL